MALEFPIELEFRNVGFCGRRKTGEPGEKPSEQGRTQPTMTPGLGFEPGPHRWEASAIPTPPYCGKVRSLPHITMVGKKLQNSQSLQSSTFAPAIIHKYIYLFTFNYYNYSRLQRISHS